MSHSPPFRSSARPSVSQRCRGLLQPEPPKAQDATRSRHPERKTQHIATTPQQQGPRMQHGPAIPRHSATPGPPTSDDSQHLTKETPERREGMSQSLGEVQHSPDILQHERRGMSQPEETMRHGKDLARQRPSSAPSLSEKLRRDMVPGRQGDEQETQDAEAVARIRRRYRLRRGLRFHPHPR